jgi:hypothetical protein
MGRHARGHNSHKLSGDEVKARIREQSKRCREKKRTMGEKYARERVKRDSTQQIDELCAWISEGNRTFIVKPCLNLDPDM